MKNPNGKMSFLRARSCFQFWGLSLIAATHLIVCACGGKGDRFEVVKKLRAIGVAATPLVQGSGTQVTKVTAFALLPKDHVVLASTFEDYASTSYAVPASTKIVDASETYKDYAALRMYQVDAEVTIPETQPDKISLARGFMTYSYHIRLVLEETSGTGLLQDNGIDEEKIVGTIIVYLNPLDLTTLQAPVLQLLSPNSDHVGSGSGSGSVQLQADIVKTTSENVRVSWYTDAGKIKNRRSLSSEWEITSGSHTLVLTARGLSTGLFANPVIKDVTIE